MEIMEKTHTDEKILKKIIYNTQKPSFILEFDMEFSFFHVNEAFQDLFLGAESTNSFFHLLERNQQGKLLETLGEKLETGTEFQMEIQLEEKNRKTAWYYLDLQKYVLDQGNVKILGFLMAISHHKAMEEQLEHIDSYFNALQELSEDLLFMIDIPTKTLMRHSGKAKMYGLEEKIKNFPVSVCESGIVHPDYVEKYMSFGRSALAGEEGNTEVLMRQGDGSFHHYQVLWTPVVKKDGTVEEIFGKMLDIQTMRDLEEKANFDSLTNTLNKQTMMDLTSRFLENSTENDYHALFFIDLDDFKAVNDGYGHFFGDFLLKSLGTRFIQNTRNGDFIGRVGGDEFVIFLRDIPSVELLIRKAKTILSAIHEDVTEGDKTVNIHASIGIAMYPDHGTSYETLYQCADRALYRSKGLGKNVATIYRPQEEEGASKWI